MDLYQKEYTLLSSDVDAGRRLRLSTLFTMLQEASIAHTTALGMGRDKTLDKGFLWIIAQQRVFIDRLPAYDEKVVLTSWPGKTMHLYFPRFYRMTAEDGSVLLEASAFWALIDQNTRAIIFPEDHGIFIDGDFSPDDPPLPKAPKMPVALQGSSSPEDAGVARSLSFIVPYSYTDLNGHMNNARYLDLAEDKMDADLRARNICEIQAEFSAEAACGSKIMLRQQQDADAFYLAGSTTGSADASLAGRRLFRLMLRYE